VQRLIADTDSLRAAHDFSLDVAGDLGFDKEQPRHRNLVALYGTQIELSGALIVVANNNAGIAVRGLFRNLLEIFVELNNLAESPEYGEYMDAAHLYEWNKSLKSARDGNPFLASIGDFPDLQNTIDLNEEKLLAYKDRKIRPLNVFEKFQRAKMEHEYRSIYNQFSSDAHGNIRSLIDRHFEFNETENDFEVVVYKNYSGEFDHLYSDAAKLLLVSGVKICSVLDSSMSEEVSNRLRQFNESQNTA
tara:strand:- start:1342 stop:2082 length:741 start_codon:yes stop_codon:yes gene_type:complete